MMMNIFSVFDPSTSLYFSFNWMNIMVGYLVIPSVFWLIPSRLNLFMNIFLSFIKKEVLSLLKIHNQYNIIMIMSLMLLLLSLNFMGLFPYIFTSTSHMSVSLSLALPFWLSIMLFGWSIKTNFMFAHLLPKGTPLMLMSFMVLIETISSLIRPLTLSIRLSANMIAGHLLMTLLGSTGPSLGYLLVMILLFVQILLIVLEMSVSIIQSYVFTMLTSLYSNEL